MYLTKAVPISQKLRRQAGASSALSQVSVTPGMIKAGVECLRDLPREDDVKYLVQAIYLAMEYERRDPVGS